MRRICVVGFCATRLRIYECGRCVARRLRASATTWDPKSLDVTPHQLPRYACPNSVVGWCVHGPARLDWRLGVAGDGRGDLDGAGLALDIDYPEPDECFLRFGERSIGRYWLPVLEPHRLGRAPIGETFFADELAGSPEVVVELAHESDHVAHPIFAHGFRRSGRRS